MAHDFGPPVPHVLVRDPGALRSHWEPKEPEQSASAPRPPGRIWRLLFRIWGDVPVNGPAPRQAGRQEQVRYGSARSPR